MSEHVITDELMTTKEFIEQNPEVKKGDTIKNSPTKQKDYKKWEVIEKEGRLTTKQIDDWQGLKGGRKRTKKHRKSRKSRRHRRSRRHR